MDLNVCVTLTGSEAMWMGLVSLGVVIFFMLMYFWKITAPLKPKKEKKPDSYNWY